MITFKQFLAEAANYPLYHTTNMYRANIILEGGGFIGRTLQRLNKKDKSRVAGLSTTRNYKFAILWGTQMVDSFVIFHLDRNMIKNNFRVVPYNYWWWWNATRDSNTESEEFVILGERKLPLKVVKQVDYYIRDANKDIISSLEQLVKDNPQIKFKSIGNHKL